jgi:protein-disulfide isomerase
MNAPVTRVFCSIVVAAFLCITAISAQSIKSLNPSTDPDRTRSKEKDIEQIVRKYLLENPEVIRDAMQALQAKEERQRRDAFAANVKKLRSEIYADADSPVGGNAKGDVSVVVFYDYFCGYCKRTLPALQTLVANDRSVRVIFKELPIMGPQSTFAAKASLAARRQGKFDEFHEAMLDAQSAREETIKAIAERLGLDQAKLSKDIDDPAITAAIERNLRLAEALGVNGTPAYLIGDELIPGAIDLDSLKKIVSSQRANLAKVEAGKAVAVQKGVN